MRDIWGWWLAEELGSFSFCSGRVATSAFVQPTLWVPYRHGRSLVSQGIDRISEVLFDLIHSRWTHWTPWNVRFSAEPIHTSVKKRLPKWSRNNKIPPGEPGCDHWICRMLYLFLPTDLPQMTCFPTIAQPSFNHNAYIRLLSSPCSILSQVKNTNRQYPAVESSKTISLAPRFHHR